MKYFVTITNEDGEVIERSDEGVELSCLADEGLDVAQDAQSVLQHPTQQLL